MNKKIYIDKLNELTNLIHLHGNNYEQKFKEFSKNVVRKEYSVGGNCIHRGYFCPSLIYDIVIGGVNRGKLLKRVQKNSKPTYEYGFDSSDNLITVKSSRYSEFVVRTGNIEYGISFDNFNELHNLTECTYNEGKLTKLLIAYYDCYQKKIKEYYEENYEYLDNELLVKIIRCSGGLYFDKDAENDEWINQDAIEEFGLDMKILTELIINRNEYRFLLKDGYLDKYTAKHYKNENEEPFVYPYDFDVNKKRRIY